MSSRHRLENRRRAIKKSVIRRNSLGKGVLTSTTKGAGASTLATGVSMGSFGRAGGAPSGLAA